MNYSSQYSSAEQTETETEAIELTLKQTAKPITAAAFDSTPRFTDLGIHPLILQALSASGYDKPTPVQQRAIPLALAGKDLLVSSPTGSGKTAAFMLPALHMFANLPPFEKETSRTNRYDQRPERKTRFSPATPKLLVLTPTRELALQITKAAETYGKNIKRLRIISILGGLPYHRQLELLGQQPKILIATPGRLLDHIGSGKIDLSDLSILVLDEADRMLDMGFVEDIEKIIAATPEKRQTLMFSATFNRSIQYLTQRFMRNPELIEIATPNQQRANINVLQVLHYVDDRKHKERILAHCLNNAALDQAIVFTATKRDADQVAMQLVDSGFSAAALHGDMPQGARNRTLRSLREKRVRILVATDVAARGIDVPGVTHVFNYDLPKSAEDYVHRIGRTGRAGRTGTAVSLAHHHETSTVKRIEHYMRKPLPASILAGFEPKLQPRASEYKFARKPYHSKRNDDYASRNNRSNTQGGYRNSYGNNANAYVSSYRKNNDAWKKPSY